MVEGTRAGIGSLNLRKTSCSGQNPPRNTEARVDLHSQSACWGPGVKRKSPRARSEGERTTEQQTRPRTLEDAAPFSPEAARAMGTPRRMAVARVRPTTHSQPLPPNQKRAKGSISIHWSGVSPLQSAKQSP